MTQIKLSNPNPQQIKNAIKKYIKNVKEGHINTKETQGIVTKTSKFTYKIKDSKIRIHEKGDINYLRINIPKEDSKYSEIGSHRIEDIVSLELSPKKHEMSLVMQNGEKFNYDLEGREQTDWRI